MNRPTIPETVKKKWQEIVNLIAELYQVPATLIMQIESSNFSIVSSSQSDGNPLKEGVKIPCGSGFYCDKVVNQRELLLVPNALEHEEWNSNPIAKMGMISYMGFPLFWPDGETFGTLCVLDNKPNGYDNLYQKALKQFCTVAETDLQILTTLETSTQDELIRKELQRASIETQNLLSESERSRKAALSMMEDLKVAKEAQKESEDKYRNLFETSLAGLYRSRIEDGKILDANQACATIFGYDRAEDYIEQFNIVDHYQDPEDRKVLLRILEKKGKVDGFEFTALKRDGTPIEISLSVAIYPDKGYLEGALFDITERKREREALEQSEYILRESQRVAGVGSYSIDLSVGFWESSESLDLIFGIGTEFERSVEGWLSIVHPDYRKEMEDYWIEEVIGKQQAFDHEYKIQRVNDQEVRWVHGLGELEFDSSGAISKMIGTIQDITKRKKDESSLLESEEKFRTIFESFQDLFYRTDIKGKLTLLSPSVEQYGYDPEELIGSHVTDFYHIPAERDNLMRELLKNGTVKDYELQLINRANSVVDASLTARLMYDNNGRPNGIEGVLRDISRRKEAQKARRESEIKFRKVIENTNDAIYLLYDGKFVLTNKKFRKMLGVTSKEIASPDFHFLDFVAPESRETVIQRGVSREQGEEPSSRYEFVALNRKGERIIVENSISLIDYEDGTAVLGLLHDITERSQLRDQLQFERDNLKQRVDEKTEELSKRVEELNQANLALEEVNQHKNSFISTMSHELRTPLNAIMGFNELLYGQYYGQLNDKQIGYVDKIAAGSKHLLALISDLLDMAKIDAGKVDLNLQEIDIKEFIESAVLMVTTQALEKKLLLSTNIDPTIKTVTVDRLRGKQILLNILTNAIKFTPRSGKIAVTALKTDNGKALIEIQDTGCGIEPDELNNIFSEFHQADKVRDQQLGGTGIGLAVSQRLAKLHGEKIGVESEVDVGSRFWFTLPISKPYEKVKANHSAPVAKSKGSSHRILIADDNQINLTLLIDILSTRDYEIFTASNGKEAVELTFANSPDLILMDMRMPVMDGLEATRAIKTDPRFANLPIISLTARASKEDIEEQIEAGCSDHLSKPLDVRDLLSLISKYLEKR